MRTSRVPVSTYELAEHFIVRLAGGPLDELDRFATPRSIAAARRLVESEDALRRAADAALAALRERKDVLAPAALERARNRIGNLRSIADAAADTVPALSHYRAALAQSSSADAELARTLDDELPAARRLSPSAQELVRQYLVFGAGHVRSLAGIVDDAALLPRTAAARQDEQTLLLYLQRICAKNDTISAYGPTAWGRIDDDDGAPAVSVAPKPGITERAVWLEKWVVERFADAINHDAECRPELCPRRHPLGRVLGDAFMREDTGEALPLDAAERDLVARCTGAVPAWRLGDDASLLSLVERGVLVWRMEAVTFDARRGEQLRDDIAAWRDGPVRTRWLARIDALFAAAARFAAAGPSVERHAASQAAHDALSEAGVAAPEPSRQLYAGANVFCEECARDCGFVLGKSVAQRFLLEAAPWLDAFRDAYSVCVARVNDRLAALLDSAPKRAGVVSLPAFVRHCEEQGTSLTGHGITAVGRSAFADVAAAFAAETAGRSRDERVWTLTPDECNFVARRFAVTRLDAFAVPAPDIHILASDWDAVRRGDYQLVVGELHAGSTPSIHCMLWASPDIPAVARALLRNTRRQPSCHWGAVHGQDKTVHNQFRWPDVLPSTWTHVSAERVAPGVAHVDPADAEVVRAADGDVRIRRRGTGADLGSFARSFALQYAVHPFAFGFAPHTPRLLLGPLVLQRETWIVDEHELLGGPYHGTSPRLLAAVERLRARRGLPRRVFVRATAEALAKKGAVGRDKDLKPVYVDFESYSFVELFSRWLHKHGELHVTEMLPTPEQTPWIEADGRYSFELRLIAMLQGT